MKIKRHDGGAWYSCPSDPRLMVERYASPHPNRRGYYYRAFRLLVNKRMVGSTWRIAEAKEMLRKHWRPNFLPDIRKLPRSHPAHALYRAACEGDAVALCALLDCLEDDGVEFKRQHVLRAAVKHRMVEELPEGVLCL